MTNPETCFSLSTVKQVIIGNIRKDTSIQDLKECFGQLIKKGDVTFKIAVDKKGKQKGFAAASVPITLVEDFLSYNGRNMKGHRITVVQSDGFKIPKSTRWQQEETGVFKSAPVQNNSLPTAPFLYDLFDAGVYLTHPKFSKNVHMVIERALSCGVQKMVLLGRTIHQCEQALSLCKLFPGSLYCTAGIGPKNAIIWTDEKEKQLLEIASSPHCVAIGECGLSPPWINSTLQQQMDVFEKQIQLSIKLKKPLVVVERKAHTEMLSLLQKYKSQLVDVAVNFIPESASQIENYIEEGCYIYVQGNAFLPNYKNWFGKWLKDTDSENIPLEKLLLASFSPHYGLQSSTDLDVYTSKADEDVYVKKSFELMLANCKDSHNEPCSLPALLIMMCRQTGKITNPLLLSKKLTHNSMTFFRLTKESEETAEEIKPDGQKPTEKMGCHWSFYFKSLLLAVIVGLFAVVAVVIKNALVLNEAKVDES